MIAAFDHDSTINGVFKNVTQLLDLYLSENKSQDAANNAAMLYNLGSLGENYFKKMRDAAKTQLEEQVRAAPEQADKLSGALYDAHVEERSSLFVAFQTPDYDVTVKVVIGATFKDEQVFKTEMLKYMTPIQYADAQRAATKRRNPSVQFAVSTR